MFRSPESFFNKIKQKFKKEDKLILITTLIAGIVTNFYFFISDGLQADALSSSYWKIAGSWETKLGRPLIQFTDMSRFGFVNQLLIVLVSLLFIAGAIMLIRRIFKIKSNLLLVILTILIAVSPQFTETYMFLYCADSYLVAFFLSALAVFALTKIKTIKESKLWTLLAICCSGYVCGLYQAYLGVILGLLIVYTLKETLSNKKVSEVFKTFIRNIFIIFLGVVAYYVVLRIGLKLAHARLAGYKGADSLGLSTILALPESIANCFQDFYQFFFGPSRIINNTYYPRFIFYIALAAVFVIGLFKKLKDDKAFKKLPFIIFLLAIFPIAISIMNIVASGTRINLVTGPGFITTSLLIVVIYEGLKETKFENIMRWVSAISLVVIAWTFIITNTFTYIVRQQEYDGLKVTFSDIYSRATQLDDYNENTKWMFSYYFNVTNARDIDKTTGMVTRNNITWTSYTGVKRYTYFFKKFMNKDIEAEDNEKYEKIIETNEFKLMPTYPAKDSVKIIDGTLVVKVSERTF